MEITHPTLLAGGPVLVLTVTDEGDSSDLIPLGDDESTAYVEAYANVGGEVVFSGIGPLVVEKSEVPCTSSVPSWAVTRLTDAADQTGGGPVEFLQAGGSPAPFLVEPAGSPSRGPSPEAPGPMGRATVALRRSNDEALLARRRTGGRPSIVRWRQRSQ